MTDRIKEYLQEARDRWDDPYWRLDHPEVTATIIALITGLVGLLFAYVQARLQARYRVPSVNDV